MIGLRGKKVERTETSANPYTHPAPEIQQAMIDIYWSDYSSLEEILIGRSDLSPEVRDLFEKVNAYIEDASSAYRLKMEANLLDRQVKMAARIFEVVLQQLEQGKHLTDITANVESHLNEMES